MYEYVAFGFGKKKDYVEIIPFYFHQFSTFFSSNNKIYFDFETSFSGSWF